MSNAATKLKAGDNLFTGKSLGRKGNDLYNSETMTYNMTSDELNVLRSRLKKLRYGYDHQSILEDIKILSKLETKLSKGQFKVAVCGNHEFHTRYIKEALFDNGMHNVVYYKDPESCIAAAKSGQFNLVFTQYDFHGKTDGRDVYTALNHNENAVGELMHVCIVNGYSPTQFMHLKRSGVDVLSCLLGEEGVIVFKDCINKLSSAYYLFHLVEMVLGKEEALAFRHRRAKTSYTLTSLESMANKSKFRILLAMPSTQVADRFQSALKRLGFNRIDFVDDVKAANDQLEKEEYSLVLSSYRFGESEESGEKIYKSLKSKTEFILVHGYEEAEMLHLERLGVMMLNHTLATAEDELSFWNDFGESVLGFYVKHVRDQLAAICQ